MTIACPECGAENPPEGSACAACNSGLEVPCARCGFANRVGDRYCGDCGIRLDQAQTQALAASTLTAQATPKRDELRTITVMMADLDGFAEMTEVYGRERQTEVMNTVIERLAEQHIVRTFDGYIDKVLDGDIMALFGAPIAHEDAPERALRSAVRMHAELAQLHAEAVIPTDTPLRLRIGLNTGPVRVGGVGAGGRMEYTAMGDTVNLAARLMTACAWGGTLISSNTFNRAGASFELEELPPVKVKGKSQPVPIWAVRAERRRAARVELAEAEGMSPMIGRDDLLAEVAEGFAAARDGRGAVVSICGEAGLGKSRLVYEVQRQVQGTPARFLEGRCLSYGANIAFLPLRDVLGEVFGLSDADTAEQRRDKIRDAVAGLGLDRAELGPPLGFILGLSFGDEAFDALDPQELRERLRASFLALLTALGERGGGVVVFLDDLQWCDADSLDIVDELVARCAGTHLLVLAAYRPDFERDWSGHAHHRRLEPARLDLEQSRRMIAGLLRGRGLLGDETPVEDSLAAAVYGKSMGNPFFIDQTVNALLERAAQTGRPTIDYRRGRLLIPEEELHDLVPGSVEEILLARIDRLPDEPRRVLQAAGVAMIGRYFRRSALEFVMEQTAADVGQALAVLQERELIRHAGGQADDQFSFEHTLARDVAYNALLRAERRRLHGRVGEYIESHYAHSLEAYVDDLSYHFYNSAFPAKALDYLPQSAARARRSFSNPQAVLHYRRALEKTEEVDAPRQSVETNHLRLSLLKGLVGVQVLIGDREAIATGRERLALAQQLGDAEAVLDASYMLAHKLTELGQFEEARSYFGMVLDEYERREDWQGLCDTEFLVGNFHAQQGHWAEALEHFQRALQMQVERLPANPFYECMANTNLAAAYEALGRFHEALQACTACAELLPKLPDDDPDRMRLEAYVFGIIGSAHTHLGELEEAVTAYRRTLAIAQATGERNIEAEVRCVFARALLLLGRVGEASTHLDEAIELSRETGNSHWEAGGLLQRGELLFGLGRLAEAAEHAAAAHAVVEQVGELAVGGELGILEARLALAGGQAATAAERLAQVAREAEEGHRPLEHATALVYLAEAEQARGDAAAAGRHLRDALALCHERGLRILEARARLVQARLAEGEEALAAVEIALALAGATRTPELFAAALGLRAELQAPTDLAAALADLEEAEARLDELQPECGEEFVRAVQQRYLAPVREQLKVGAG